MKYLKFFENKDRKPNWKTFVDENKIYTKDVGFFKVVGKFIPERKKKSSSFQKNTNAYFLHGYIIYTNDRKEQGEPYRSNVTYYDWKIRISESTPEEIEYYKFYNNANKYNL